MLSFLGEPISCCQCQSQVFSGSVQFDLAPTGFEPISPPKMPGSQARRRALRSTTGLDFIFAAPNYERKIYHMIFLVDNA